MQPIFPAMLISSHMCGKTGQLFKASAVQGQELNTDEEVKGGGSDEDIFCFSCMMGPGRSSMMALRPHGTAASMGAWSEWKRTLSSIIVGEEGGDRETDRSRLGSLKAEKLIILPVFFDVITPNWKDGRWEGGCNFGVSGGRCVWRDGWGGSNSGARRLRGGGTHSHGPAVTLYLAQRVSEWIRPPLSISLVSFTHSHTHTLTPQSRFWRSESELQHSAWPRLCLFLTQKHKNTRTCKKKKKKKAGSLAGMLTSAQVPTTIISSWLITRSRSQNLIVFNRREPLSPSMNLKIWC